MTLLSVSILFRYELRMVYLFVLSWARVQRVALGRVDSVLLLVFVNLLWFLLLRYLLIAVVCISFCCCLCFVVDICVVVYVVK